jgi:hypothetical protein
MHARDSTRAAKSGKKVRIAMPAASLMARCPPVAVSSRPPCQVVAPAWKVLNRQPALLGGSLSEPAQTVSTEGALLRLEADGIEVELR